MGQLLGIQLRLQDLVGNLVQFQGEEQQLGGDRVHFLAGGLVKLRDLWIADRTGVKQLRIRHDLAEDFVDRLILLDRHPQRFTG